MKGPSTAVKDAVNVDDEDVIHNASGWRTNIVNSSTVESGVWKNARPSSFLLEETMLKSDKITCVFCC